MIKFNPTTKNSINLKLNLLFIDFNVFYIPLINLIKY